MNMDWLLDITGELSLLLNLIIISQLCKGDLIFERFIIEVFIVDTISLDIYKQ